MQDLLLITYFFIQTITFSSPEMSSSPALPKVSRSQLLTEEDTCQIDSEFLSHQVKDFVSINLQKQEIAVET